MINLTFSQKDQEIISQCIGFIIESNYLDDNEFQTRIGINRNELKGVRIIWASQGKLNSEIALIGVNNCLVGVNNCLNEICYGLEIKISDWKKWFDFEKKDAIEMFSKWQQSVSSLW